MHTDFSKYNLEKEEVNMIEAFMLLYGYSSIKSFMEKDLSELQKHKDWNLELENIYHKMKGC